MPCVLIAEPNYLLATAYAEALAGSDFEIRLASSGLDCIGMLRVFQPKVLVLNLDLLWGQGEDVLALLRSDVNMPAAEVILLCDRDSCAYASMMQQLQIRHCLRKPVPLSGLKALILDLMTSRQAERGSLVSSRNQPRCKPREDS